MEWIAIVTALALIECLFFSFRVGLARNQHGVKAPATTGHDIFERHYRVHHNTLEQLVVFLPALWLFGRYVSAPIGAGIGAVFLVGRLVYGFAYVADPSSRTLGFLMGYLATVVLLLGGLGGAVLALT